MANLVIVKKIKDYKSMTSEDINFRYFIQQVVIFKYLFVILFNQIKKIL